MKLKIINTSNNPMPAYATESAAGMDIRANLEESVTLGSLDRILIPTGLYLEIPKGYEAQLRPRSGLALKQGITLLNSPGTIDADYRGEIGVIIANLSKDPVTIAHGERICQMIIAKYEHVVIEEVTQLSETERGSGGFGHTGKK